MSNPVINAKFRSLNLIAAQYTDVTGTEPGTGSLTIAVDEFGRIPRNGDLTISDGNRSITRKRCRTTTAEFGESENDVNASLQIQDRRWRLPYLGTVSGIFNRRDDNGGVVGETKTARELAEMCLQALGEKSYDAAAMPTDEKPFVEWDHTPAKEALENIMATYGVMFVLTGNDSVRLVKRGDGDEAANGFVTARTSRFPITVRPRTIVVVAGRSHCQISKIKLEPVAAENGKLTPLHEVSFSPKNMGFEFSWSFGKFLREVKQATEKSEQWNRAAYRWYRLPATITIDGESVSREEAITRILPDIIDATEVAGDGFSKTMVRDKAFITGKHTTERSLHDPLQITSAKTTDRVQTSFSIDKKLGAIIFSQPVNFIENGIVVDPQLELTAAFLGALKNSDRLHKYTYPIGQATVADLTLTVQLFGTRLGKIDGKKQNADVVKKAAEAALENARRELNISATARTETHGQIVPVDLNGKREQASYGIGSSGPATTISIGYEHDLIIPTKNQKQARRRVNATTKNAERKIKTGYEPGGDYVNRE